MQIIAFLVEWMCIQNMGVFLNWMTFLSSLMTVKLEIYSNLEQYDAPVEKIDQIK